MKTTISNTKNNVLCGSSIHDSDGLLGSPAYAAMHNGWNWD